MPCRFGRDAAHALEYYLDMGITAARYTDMSLILRTPQPTANAERGRLIRWLVHGNSRHPWNTFIRRPLCKVPYNVLITTSPTPKDCLPCRADKARRDILLMLFPMSPNSRTYRLSRTSLHTTSLAECGAAHGLAIHRLPFFRRHKT